jgi:hypothetical protein
MGRPLGMCNKCGGTNTTLMFMDYICNVCEPVKGTPPVARASLKDRAKLKRGWVFVPHDHQPEDSLYVMPGATVYPTQETVRSQHRVRYDSEIKEVYMDTNDGGYEAGYYRMYKLVNSDVSEKFWYDAHHYVARLVESL